MKCDRVSGLEILSCDLTPLPVVGEVRQSKMLDVPDARFVNLDRDLLGAWLGRSAEDCAEKKSVK